MKNTRELLNANPFEYNDELFIGSFKESAIKHYNCCPYFKNLVDEEKIDINVVKTINDLESFPFINVYLLKLQDFYNDNYNKFVLNLKSSGTSGQTSQIYLDQESLDNVKTSAFQIYKGLGAVSPDPCNYLCFTYDPHKASDLGTAFTDELLTSFAPAKKIFYTFQWSEDKGDFIFDEEETYKALVDFAQSELPLRILGLPAHLYFLIEKFDIKLKLNENSWLLSGGGWKVHSQKMIEKNEFRNLIKKRLGIKTKNQRDLFGMVEHGIAYLEDDRGRMRIPNYARVFVRDPYTLKTLKGGELGLLQFMCSYNFSYPSINILSNDWGRVLEDDRGQYIVLEGRAGIKKHKGCALKANELMVGK